MIQNGLEIMWKEEGSLALCVRNLLFNTLIMFQSMSKCVISFNKYNSLAMRETVFLQPPIYS